MGIRLATFQQHQLTAQDYALLCAKSVSSGIFYGCNVTIKDESTLHVTTGVGIANGRTFDVTDDDYHVELTGGGSMVGRIYVHVDLADVDTPAQILVVKGATLPALVQDTDMNESTGVWDLELATFDVDASEISNLVYTASGVSGGGGGAMLAPYYDASEAWLKGQIFQKDGVLYKCLTDIAVGAPLVVGTNVKVTNFAEETEALNQNLMNISEQVAIRYVENSDQVQVYKNGVWVDWVKTSSGSLVSLITRPLSSNTTNEGTCSSNSYNNTAYKAFNSSNQNAYIDTGVTYQFTFINPTLVNVLQASKNGGNCGIALQYSIDGTNWITASTIPWGSSGDLSTTINTTIKAFRVVGQGTSGYTAYVYGVGAFVFQ